MSFNKYILTKKIGISVGELMRNIDKNVEDILQCKLKALYEGVLFKEGYVKDNSIVILEFSVGIMKNVCMEYDVEFECIFEPRQLESVTL